MEALSRLLAEGDPRRSWSLFLDGFLGTVTRAARRVAADPDEADDLVVAVLEKWSRGWPQLLDRYRALPAPDAGAELASFRAWLAVVARNAVIDAVRARRGRQRPAVAADAPPWLKEAYGLVSGEGWTVQAAWESQRDSGAFAGTFGEYRAALDQLRANVPPRRTARAHTLGDAAEGVGAFETSLEASAAPDVTGARDPLLVAAIQRAFGEAIAALSGDERRLLRVYYLEGVPATELVRALGGKTPSQVYNRVHRVLEKLRQAVAARGIDARDLDALACFDWHAAVGPTEEAP